MNNDRYPIEHLDDEIDDGTMPSNLEELTNAVVGHRIVSAEGNEGALVLTLDNGRKVTLVGQGDCCAYTALDDFFLDPSSVDHMILGVGTTDGYTTWHIFADFGDIMQMQVGWSAGNTGYYMYGFAISVEDAT